jgi:hypothetical protein
VARAVKEAESGLPRTDEEAEEQEANGPGRESGKADGGGHEHLSDDEEDEVEEKVDAGTDDPKIMKLACYAATKEFVPRPVPRPFRLTNAKILKTPRLWPLLMDWLELEEGDLVSARGLDGEVLRAFTEAFTEFYTLPEGGAPVIDVGLLRELKDKFKLLGGMYLNVKEPETLFVGVGESLMNGAEKIVATMDGVYLGRVFGREASAVFKRNTRISLGAFSDDSVSAVRLAIRRSGGASAKPDNKGGSKACNRCGRTVPFGVPFAVHNKTCPRRR